MTVGWFTIFAVKLHLPLLLLLIASSLLAQTRKLSPKDLPPSAFKLISVKITGTDHYMPEEITEAAHLKIGETFTNDDFKAATERLGASGLFSDVAYTYQYSGEGTRLTLQLTETDKLVPVRFDNIVWYSDDELLAQLHERVPLFHGRLPVAGNLPDRVSDALQALMVDRGVSGKVDYLRAGAENGPVEAIVYSVKGPDIRIRKIAFQGASPAELDALNSAATRLEGADYLRSALRMEEDKVFRPVYLERGYLKSSFGDAQAKVVEGSANPTLVDVTFPVVPGPQFKISAVRFTGEKAFPGERLGAMVHLKPGEPANAVELQEDTLAIKKLYGTKGYMAVTIEPKPEFDDAQAMVNYAIEVSEGDVYKMGELTIEGLDKETTARLEEDWKLRGGDAYDSSYPHRFLTETTEALKGMGKWNETVHEAVDDKDKIVDVTIRYDPKA